MDVTQKDKPPREPNGQFPIGNDEGFSSRPQDICKHPTGRPSGPSLTRVIKEKLTLEGVEGVRASGKEIMAAMAYSIFREVILGSAPHAKLVSRLLDGKSGDQLEYLLNGDMSIDEFKSEAIMLYRSVIRDPNASNREKLYAQNSLNELLGLTINVTPPQENARAVHAALDAMDEVSCIEEPDADEVSEE